MNKADQVNPVFTEAPGVGVVLNESPLPDAVTSAIKPVTDHLLRSTGGDPRGVQPEATRLPTEDEFFNTHTTPLPTEDEFFGKSDASQYNPPRGGTYVPQPVQELVDAFMEGHGPYGSSGLSDNSIKQLRALGIFNDYQKGQGELGKAALEAIVRPGAFILEEGMKTLAGVVEAGAVRLAGKKMGHDIAGAILDPGVAATLGPVLAPWEGITALRRNFIEEAKKLKVIGAGEEGYAGVPRPGTVQPEATFANEAAALKSQTQATMHPYLPPREEVPDLPTLAREAAPDTMQQYDALREKQAEIKSRHIDAQDQHTTQLLQDAPQTSKIEAAQLKLAELESQPGHHGLRTKLTQQLEDLTKERETWVDAQPPSSEVTMLGRQLSGVSDQIYSLAPDVVQAHADARTKFDGLSKTADDLEARATENSPPPRVEGTPAEAGSARYDRTALKDENPGLSRSEIENVLTAKVKQALNDGDAVTLHTGQPASIVDVRDGMFVDKQGRYHDPELISNPKGKPNAIVIKKSGERPAPTFPVQETPGKLPAPGAPPEAVARFRETVGTGQINQPEIFADASQRFQKAGRTKKEADATAAIVSAYYDTRAARFDGAKGTAQELYNKEFPKVKTGKNRTNPDGSLPTSYSAGNYNEKTNTLKLLERADHSTIIHELGHKFMADLFRDAADAKAPPHLLKDRDSVLKWFGVRSADEVMPRHKEKFARGFETYLMEGRAPNKELSGVFAQFRDWMFKIYQSLTDLKAPLSEDVRGFFDRLLVHSPDRQPVSDELKSSGPVAPTILSQTRKGKKTDKTEKPEGKVTKGPSTPSPSDPQATLDTPRQYTTPSGNVSLDMITEGSDVENAVKEVANLKGDFAEARRGRMPVDETLALGDALGMDAKRLDRRRIGQAFNAEQIVAAVKLLVQSAMDVRDKMIRAAHGSEEDVLNYAEVRERHRLIQENVSGVTAEAGRALSIFRAFRQSGATDTARKLWDVIGDSQNRTLDQLRTEARRGASLDTPTKVSKYINDRYAPTWADMATEVWINSLLSGPQTHVTNMLSNSLVALYSIPEAAAKAAVGSLRAMTKPGIDRVYWGEVGERVWGMAQGAKEGVRAGWAILKDEELSSKAANFGDVSSANKVEARHFQSVPGITGRVLRAPTRLLTAEDQVFKQIAFRQEINAQAYRRAMQHPEEEFASRLADYKLNPDSKMVADAREFADVQTFNNKLGSFGQAISRATNAHPFAKVVIPFVRTPLNIVHYALQRSIAAPMYKAVREDLLGKNGAEAQSAATARMALGSAVSLAAVTLAAEGNLSGSGPTDPRHQALLRATGWQPYSVKIGDYWYSYGRMEPLGTLFGVAADIVDAAKLTTQEEHEHLAGLMLASVTKNLVNKTWLKGPSDLIQAVTEPERYGDRYAQSLLGTLVPALVSQTLGASDPYLYRAKSLLDGFKQRTGLATTETNFPGMSPKLYPKRDTWGEPIPRGEGVGPDVLSPIYMSKMNNDPVNQALLQLKVYPGKLSDKIRGVQLSDEQYDDYQRMAGRYAKYRLDNVVNSSSFQRAPEGIQREMLQNNIKEAHSTIQSVMMQQNRDIIQKAKEAKRKQAGQ